ncbi:MAG: protein-L-isoaspartate(D-aspartate) O-methyltransferase [Candidatus Omnitrophica bacterium]|nr:protein-L-isoaspartate(D-aspartate) O-methyltransferase [Candidatus Omnitrophota bacterium]MBD3268857.1 protein-L-isoaspartate(D-aspartate) O-methyltransferase [Candidatus Omnitrophota bacterium]
MGRDNFLERTLLLGFILLIGISMPVFPERSYSVMRKEMVDKQIIKRGIKNERVIEAIRKVPRHKFVPDHYKAVAYTDGPLPIGEGQTISQPYVVALMTELLNLQGDEKVLEIGTGSGYQAAVLAELADKVYTVEIIKELAEKAKSKLKNLGYKNVKVKYGDGFKGWEEYAPFDAIIVTCAPKDIPGELVKQLKEGGGMVIPVGRLSQELKLVTKKDGKVRVEDIIPVRFVPMTGGKEK